MFVKVFVKAKVLFIPRVWECDRLVTPLVAEFLCWTPTLTGQFPDNIGIIKKWRLKLTSLVVIQSSGTDAFVWRLFHRLLIQVCVLHLAVIRKLKNTISVHFESINQSINQVPLKENEELPEPALHRQLPECESQQLVRPLQRKLCLRRFQEKKKSCPGPEIYQFGESSWSW